MHVWTCGYCAKRQDLPRASTLMRRGDFGTAGRVLSDELVHGTRGLVAEAQLWAPFFERRGVKTLPPVDDEEEWRAIGAKDVPPTELGRAKRFVARWWRAHRKSPTRRSLSLDELRAWANQSERSLADPSSLMHDSEFIAQALRGVSERSEE